jgi:hypothetical protein
MLSSRRPEEVIPRKGQTGCNVLILLVILLGLGIWILLNPTGSGPGTSPSPSEQTSPSPTAETGLRTTPYLQPIETTSTDADIPFSSTVRRPASL